MICNIIMCKCFPTNGVNFDLPFNVIFFDHKKSNTVSSITGIQHYNNGSVFLSQQIVKQRRMRWWM